MALERLVGDTDCFDLVCAQALPSFSQQFTLCLGDFANNIISMHTTTPGSTCTALPSAHVGLFGFVESGVFYATVPLDNIVHLDKHGAIELPPLPTPVEGGVVPTDQARILSLSALGARLVADASGQLWLSSNTVDDALISSDTDDRFANFTTVALATAAFCGSLLRIPHAKLRDDKRLFTGPVVSKAVRISAMVHCYAEIPLVTRPALREVGDAEERILLVMPVVFSWGIKPLSRRTKLYAREHGLNSFIDVLIAFHGDLYLSNWKLKEFFSYEAKTFSRTSFGSLNSGGVLGFKKKLPERAAGGVSLSEMFGDL